MKLCLWRTLVAGLFKTRHQGVGHRLVVARLEVAAGQVKRLHGGEGVGRGGILLVGLGGGGGGHHALYAAKVYGTVGQGLHHVVHE